MSELSADPVRDLPLITSGGYRPGSPIWRRGIGCMWNHDGTVTILVQPDSGDDCRAIMRLTARAAEGLAEELERCSRWARAGELNDGTGSEAGR